MHEPLFIQLGMGLDLRGMDTTTAAVRAVRNAIGHNLLPGIPALLQEGGRVIVHVRLAVPSGVAAVDIEAIREELPIGSVSVEIVTGGMLTPNGLAGLDEALVVNAAVEIRIER